MNITPGDIRIWHEGEGGGTSDPWFNSLQLVRKLHLSRTLAQIFVKQSLESGSDKCQGLDRAAEKVDKGVPGDCWKQDPATT